MQHETLRVIHDEHRALAALLHALRALAARVADAPRPADFEILRAILFYVDEFPERRHHRKESELLFPRLRARAPQAGQVLDRLDTEHLLGERMIRDLERALLAYEQLGRSRRQAFLDAASRFANFYTAHMQLEETEVLPLARRALEPEDWRELDAAFAENRDPLTGHAPEDEYRELFRRIVALAPAPIGVGPAS